MTKLNSIDPDTTIPVKTDRSVARIVDGEAVVVEPGNGLLNVINKVGTRIWELTDGKRTVREIAEQVAGDFDVARDRALADTIEFLQDLNAKGLVILKSEGSRLEQKQGPSRAQNASGCAPS